MSLVKSRVVVKRFKCVLIDRTIPTQVRRYKPYKTDKTLTKKSSVEGDGLTLIRISDKENDNCTKEVIAVVVGCVTDRGS